MQRTTLSKGFVVLAALAIGGTTIAGIQGSGLRRVATFGRITAVAPITVNGVEYAAMRARISIDGVGGYQRDLRVGQVVSLTGSVDESSGTGLADEISFVGDVRGVITAVDRASRTFTVLDQTVRVTDETIVDGAPAFAALNLRVGTAVEASGFANASGELLVTRIDTRVENAVAQVRGIAADFDRHGHTFRVNQLLVDYDDAEIEGLLAEGATVVVQGEVDRGAGALHAERVDVPLQLGAPGQKGDVEGIVTSYASDAEFVLNGLRIVADENTRYVLHGVTLGPDVPLHVSGRFGVGALVADKVEVRNNALRQTSAKAAKKPKKWRRH